MKLTLSKPLIFFDLETTGVNISYDRIVQIAAIKIHPDGAREQINQYINPQRPIPAEATAIHGISDAMVANCPCFGQKAHELLDFFKGADLAGFAVIKFDIPLLVEEFLRCRIATFPEPGTHFIDAQVIFHRKEERTLKAALKLYCGYELENAHDALSDTQASLEVFEAQLESYEDLPRDIAALGLYSLRDQKIVDFAGKLAYDNKGEIVYNFGKHKGVRVKDHPGYAEWTIGADFPRHTVKILHNILDEMYKVEDEEDEDDLFDRDNSLFL